MPSYLSSFLFSPSVEGHEIRPRAEINEKEKYVHCTTFFLPPLFLCFCIPGRGSDSWTDFCYEIGGCAFGVGLSYRATSTSIGSVTTSVVRELTVAHDGLGPWTSTSTVISTWTWTSILSPCPYVCVLCPCEHRMLCVRRLHSGDTV